LPIIHEIRLNNDSRLGDAQVMAYLHIAEGEPLDILALEAQIGTLYGLELFQIVFWELEHENGKNVLTIHVREKPWGPNYVQIGIGVADDFNGDNTFNFALAYTQTAINSLGGEWRTAVAIGSEPEFFTELYQPLDSNNRYFINPGLFYRKRAPNIFDSEGNKLAEIEVETAEIVLAAGRQLGTWGEIRLGATRGTGNLNVRVGDPSLGGAINNLDFDTGEVFWQLAADKIDNLDFPTHGYFAGLKYLKSLDSLGASDEYDQYDIGLTYAHTWGRNTGLFSAAATITPDNDAPVQGLPNLGGLFNLSGFSQNELSGQHSARVSTVWYRKISDLALLPAYAGFSLEYGNVFQEKGDIKFDNGLWAGALFVGVDSFIGPVYLGYGLAEGGTDSLYLFVGRLFTDSSR
jgi:NTE family protein